MATLVEIHEGIVDCLNNVPGLRAFAYPPQSPTPPVAYPVLESWEPSAMGRAGTREFRFSVYVFTAQAVRPQDGYQPLMEFADRVIEQAIWDGNDRSAGTFAGLAGTFAHVTQFSVLGAEQVDAREMYGGVFTVNVITTAGA